MSGQSQKYLRNQQKIFLNRNVFLEIIVSEFIKSEKTITNLKKIIESKNIIKFANPRIVAKSRKIFANPKANQ